MKEQLIRKIENREARIGVIGLGYVGLPLVIHFAGTGFRVMGFDVDINKVNCLNRGESYIDHIPAELIAGLVKKGTMTATDNFHGLSEMDCIIICVPTPLTENEEPDLQYVKATTETIAMNLKKGQLISLESTTYPGTTDELLLPRFQQKGLKAGEDFFLVFSPEREDPGNKKYNTRTIPKVVGGVTSACLKLGETLYGQIVERVVPVSSTRAAELVKLFENIFRSVNIALVNEMKMLCDRMGINVWEIIEAASTKPFGFMPFYPGPGLGGHCLPIDPFYLSWKAKQYGFSARFIELAGQVNTHMPHYVIEKVTDALNKKGKSVKGSKILLLGIAYKKDVDDARESPAFALIKMLKRKEAEVMYNDPYIPLLPETRKYKFRLESQELTEQLLKNVDLVLIATDHNCYDYDWICKHAGLIVDTRNAIKDTGREKQEKVVKA